MHKKKVFYSCNFYNFFQFIYGKKWTHIVLFIFIVQRDYIEMAHYFLCCYVTCNINMWIRVNYLNHTLNIGIKVTSRYMMGEKWLYLDVILINIISISLTSKATKIFHLVFFFVNCDKMLCLLFLRKLDTQIRFLFSFICTGSTTRGKKRIWYWSVVITKDTFEIYVGLQ